MNRRFRLTEQAETDVMEIWLYVAADNTAAADKSVDRFTETFEMLSANPGIGTLREEYRSHLRSFPVGNYVIFYHEGADGIEIYRVLHGARYFENLL